MLRSFESTIIIASVGIKKHRFYMIQANAAITPNKIHVCVLVKMQELQYVYMSKHKSHHMDNLEPEV